MQLKAVRRNHDVSTDLCFTCTCMAVLACGVQEETDAAAVAAEAAQRIKAAESRAAAAASKERRREELYALNAILRMCVIALELGIQYVCLCPFYPGVCVRLMCVFSFAACSYVPCTCHTCVLIPALLWAALPQLMLHILAS